MRRLVLCSGGLKSTYLAAVAKKEGEVVLLFYNYGQVNNVQEEKAACRLAEYYNLPLSICGLLGYPPVKETLLRFFYFVFQALPMAQKLKCHMIYHGLSFDEEKLLIDNREIEPFIKAFQALFVTAQPRYGERGHWQQPVELETPLRRIHVEHVLRLGNEWNVPWEQTWSCEQNGKYHCGECFPCRRRYRSFVRESGQDNTRYYNGEKL